MDKLSEEIISHVKSLRKPYGRFSASHVARALNRDSKEVSAACEYLVQNGFAEPLNGGYKLTHTAAKKEEFDKLTRRRLWKNRLWSYIIGIATGITVEAVTGGLTALVQWLSLFLFQE